MMTLPAHFQNSSEKATRVQTIAMTAELCQIARSARLEIHAAWMTKQPLTRDHMKSRTTWYIRFNPGRKVLIVTSQLTEIEPSTGCPNFFLEKKSSKPDSLCSLVADIAWSVRAADTSPQQSTAAPQSVIACPSVIGIMFSCSPTGTVVRKLAQLVLDNHQPKETSGNTPGLFATHQQEASEAARFGLASQETCHQQRSDNLTATDLLHNTSDIAFEPRVVSASGQVRHSWPCIVAPLLELLPLLSFSPSSGRRALRGRQHVLHAWPFHFFFNMLKCYSCDRERTPDKTGLIQIR